MRIGELATSHLRKQGDIKVIKKFEGDKGLIDLSMFKDSRHFKQRAKRRETEITEIYDMFIVEKDGKLQLHIILTNATIIIVDKEKGKIITTLNARVSQIKRYYTYPDRPSRELLDLADSNKVSASAYL